MAIALIGAIVIYLASPLASIPAYRALDESGLGGKRSLEVITSVYAPADWLYENVDSYKRYIDWCKRVVDR